MNKEVSIFYKIIEMDKLLLLVPDKVLIGQLSKDKNKFYDELSSMVYYNSEYIFDSNFELDGVFDNVTTVDILKEKYGSNDYLNKYFDESLKKAFYYDYSNKNLDLESCSIDEFRDKYELDIKYNRIKNDENKFNTDEEEVEIDICENRNISKDIKTLALNFKNKILFQDKPIEELLLTLFNNYIVENDNSNIIICGESGVGKTKILNEIEKCSNIPMAFLDFKNFNYDYVENLEVELLCELFTKSNYNLDLAQKGIIVIDNVEEYEIIEDFIYKLDCFYQAMTNILNKKSLSIKFINSEEIINFNTQNLTIILSGQFKEMFKNIEKPVQVPLEFFNEKSKIKEYKIGYSKEDLNYTYYTMNNLFDSFDTVITFNSLTKENIKEILLKTEDSPLNHYKKALEEQNVSIKKIPNEAVEYICDKVYKNKTNCKGLKMEIRSLFKKSLMEIMKTEYDDLELKMKKDIIYNPEGGYQLKKKKID